MMTTAMMITAHNGNNHKTNTQNKQRHIRRRLVLSGNDKLISLFGVMRDGLACNCHWEHCQQQINALKFYHSRIWIWLYALLYGLSYTYFHYTWRICNVLLLIRAERVAINVVFIIVYGVRIRFMVNGVFRNFRDITTPWHNIQPIRT